MKIKINRTLFALMALSIVNLQTSTADAAVAFTVTPSAVSNTYKGTITLQVTGLTNTETVVVQKFLDLNTNGLINANDSVYIDASFGFTANRTPVAFSRSWTAPGGFSDASQWVGGADSELTTNTTIRRALVR